MKMILNGYPHYDKSNLQRLNSKRGFESYSNTKHAILLNINTMHDGCYSFYIVQSPIYSFIITVLMVISVLNHYYFRETIHFSFY